MKNSFTMRRMVSALRASVVAMLLTFTGIGASAQVANLVFNPSTTTVQVNDVFTVNVAVDFVAAGTLSSVDAYVNFNPLDLEVTTMPVVPPSTVTLLPGESQGMQFNNTTGRVDHARFISSPTGHPNADFVFYTITFRAKRIPPGGITTISFNSTLPRQSIILEGFTQLNGALPTQNITINPPAGCTLINASIGNTPTCDGQPFSLTLASVTGGISPFSVTVDGTTYNNVIAGAAFANITPPSYNIIQGTPASSYWEDNPLELGVRFQSSVAGYIYGVRFFSDANADDNAIYTGTLRAANGTLLAQGAFALPTPDNSWRTLMFTAPVQIAANTTYLATYHTTGITHAELPGGLASPITNTAPNPLSTIAQGGVYRYGAFTTTGAGFNNTNNNYYADVLFTPAQYSFNFTSITDAGACTISGSPNIQTLTVNSVSCGLLPVTLLSLSATPEGKNNIKLNWSTASEIDNDGFEIQRSADNASWEGITYVKGAGNSSTIKNYTYTDANLFPRRYYYRLKQVDIDRKYKYSAIVTATVEGKPESTLGQNFPNPFKRSTTILYTLAKTSKVNLTVFDMHGRAMKVLVSGTQDAGSHAHYFYSGSLPSGVYYYRLQADGFTSVKKLVIR